MNESLLIEIEKIQNSTSIKPISLSDKERLIFNKAYNLLSRREHSKTELTSKLKLRLPEQASLIHSVVQKLEESGYLSNSRYKEMIIKKLLKKGISEPNIKSELKSHSIQVDNDEIKAIANELGLNKSDQIQFLINKKIRLIKQKPIQKQRESLIRYLTGKGYSYDEIKGSIENALNQSF
jgi:regulatory protein